MTRRLVSLGLGMALLAVNRGLDSQAMKAVVSEMRLGLHGAGTGGRWRGAGTGGCCLGAGTGEHLRGVELANLGNSRDRGLDGTSRDGERLYGTSGDDGVP